MPQARAITPGQRQGPLQAMNRLLVQGSLVLLRQLFEGSMQCGRNIFQGNGGTIHDWNHNGCVSDVNWVVERGLQSASQEVFL